MKVLHVLWYSEFGGVENYTRNLFVELERRGHSNVLVLAGRVLDGVRRPGRVVHEMPEVIDTSSSVASRVHQALAAVVAEQSPDVAYLHTAMNAAASRLLLDRLPSVYFAHNYTAFCPSGALYYRSTHATCHFESAPSLGCLANAYLKGCNSRRPDRLLASYRRSRQTKDWTRQADAIVCDSEYVRQRHARAGFDARRIHVVPSPVRIPDRPPPDSSDSSIVLFAGRLVAGKGLETLVDALPAISTAARLVVAGEGPLRPALEAKAAARGVAARLDFRGRLSEADLARLYEESAVVVVPSEWPEPLGMVGAEALAHSRPVVGTAAGGSAEWLLDGVTGLATPVADPAALAAAVNRLLDDRQLAARLGAAGRELVEGRFTIENHTDALLKVFEGVVARRQVTVGFD